MPEGRHFDQRVSCPFSSAVSTIKLWESIYVVALKGKGGTSASIYLKRLAIKTIKPQIHARSVPAVIEHLLGLTCISGLVLYVKRSHKREIM